MSMCPKALVASDPKLIDTHIHTPHTLPTTHHTTQVSPPHGHRFSKAFLAGVEVWASQVGDF